MENVMTKNPQLNYQIHTLILWLGYLTLGTAMVVSFVAQANSSQYQQSIDYHAIESGSLFIKNKHGFKNSVATDSSYSIEVTGLMARVTLNQSFSNRSNDWVEAIYAFPLANGVAVDDMTMRIGERVIKGKIAKKQGKKASLVEQERPNLFTTSVANIAPNENISITISYLQVLPMDNDTFSLRLPLTINPRYIPIEYKQAVLQAEQEYIADEIAEHSKPVNFSNGSGWSRNTKTVIDASRVTPFMVASDLAAKAKIDIKLNVGLPTVNVKSLYHSITLSENVDGNNSSHIELAKSAIPMDRDFVLQWQIAPSSRPQAAFFKETKGNYHYGLFMVNPPAIKGRHQQINKDMLYIIDTSGSMGGTAIVQAKQALQYAIQSLSPSDSFNIIEFNSTHSSLFNQSRVADKGNVNSALNWISKLQANGGTEMLPALHQALVAPSKSGLLKQIIFITDGSIGNEEQLFQAIAAQLGNARLHTVGIGSAPNSYFMEQAAQMGRGNYFYIGNINEVNSQMATLFNKINTPMLTDILINWPSSNVEMLPNKVPDLYANEPLVISARWPVADEIKSSNAMRAEGQISEQIWQQDLMMNQAPQQSGVATWWARQKITQLNYQMIKHYGNDTKRESLKQEITKLAIDNRLLSKYTSFVAIEKTPSRLMTELLKKQALKNAMPNGSTLAIPLANTATWASAQLKVGFILLLIVALCMLAKSVQRKSKDLQIDLYVQQKMQKLLIIESEKVGQ